MLNYNVYGSQVMTKTDDQGLNPMKTVLIDDYRSASQLGKDVVRKVLFYLFY